MLASRRLRILPLILTLACGPDTAETGDTDSDEDPALVAACDALCGEQRTCQTTTLSAEECGTACLADIGTPGDACTQAIEALASCMASDCDESACGDAWSERDASCGGRG
ncbi:MAG: hypothetical protein KC636_01945 [Myxococcales bacterium]|nr:hypothetical protein [Myxococcales bacterium]